MNIHFRFIISTSILWTIYATTITYGNNVTGKTKLPQPNILIMLADDLGWGDVGCYGNSTLKTPNIDRLAKEGALFSHAIAAASICTPSRAALLTGRYPIRTGLTSSGVYRVVPFVASSGGLRPEEITFAKLAQRHNYSTGLMGKWHLGLHCNSAHDYCHHPLNHGFDSFYGMPWTNTRDLGGEEAVVDTRLPHLRKLLMAIMSITAVTVLILRSKKKNHKISMLLFVLCLFGIGAPGFIYFTISNLRILNGIVMRNYTVVEQPVRIEGIHKRFIQEAKDFIRWQHDQQKPFLMVLAFTHSHSALKPTIEFRGKSRHGLYGDIVEELDSGVGQMLNFLDDLNIAQDTFILFTSDQGAHLEEIGIDGSRHGGYNGILRGGKGMGGMEGGIRVPMLVRWPRLVSAGLHIQNAVSLMDVYPTVASMVGAPLPGPIDGEDLLPLIINYKDTQSIRQRFLAHYCGISIHAARWANNDTHVWKAVFATPNWLPNTTTCHFLCSCKDEDVTFHDPPLMYNVAEDPSESHPIYFTDPQYQEAIKIINEQIKNHHQSLTPVENQLTWPKSLWHPWLQPCCSFPLCHCTEEKYKNLI
ncbi:hypothetical protein CHUAL_012609 [Chamberlinius hualienensis]